VIPLVEQMIEIFLGMDFGQYDYLGERMFFEQESQPGGSSSAHQFPHGPPPHFVPQYRPGLQLFTSRPQMFAGQFVGSQFAGPYSGPPLFTSSFVGQIPPFSVGAQF
jgi:hypothetical protein